MSMNFFFFLSVFYKKKKKKKINKYYFSNLNIINFFLNSRNYCRLLILYLFYSFMNCMNIYIYILINNIHLVKINK